MNSTPEETQQYLQELASESKALTKQLYEMCWFMRGSITREEAWALSYQERKMISEIIQANIENTEKSGLPLL